MSQINAKRFLSALGFESVVSTNSILGHLIQSCLSQGPTHGMTLDTVADEIKAMTGLTFDRVEIRICVENDKSLEVSILSNEPPHLVISNLKRTQVVEDLRKSIVLSS